MTEQERLLAERIERERMREWVTVNGGDWKGQDDAMRLVMEQK
jgi:hypothetical protein